MYGWAPLALMGEEINKLDTPADRAQQTYSTIVQDAPSEMARLSAESSGAQERQLSRTSDDHSVGPTSTEGGQLAGIYLGVWNIFAVIPQFLATFLSAVVFSILEPGKSPELTPDTQGAPSKDVNGPIAVQHRLSGTAVCLAIGALCSFVAAWRTFRLRRMSTPDG